MNTSANGRSRPARNSFDQRMIQITPTAYLSGDGYFGRFLSLVLLIVLAPVILVLLLLTRVTSKGPGLYRQVRVGKDGRIFVMYKIRSMRVDAEAATGPVWTQDESDPRITLLGGLLRRFHLDELPQLVNVVKGEMSLFGPRPERPELVHILADNIPNYMDRLAVRPGITGLAQINLPPDSDLESVRRKLQLDVEYIQKGCFLLDCRMFFWTVLRLLGVPNLFASNKLGLSRDIKPVQSKSNQPVSIAQLLDSSQDIRTTSGAAVRPAVAAAASET